MILNKMYSWLNRSRFIYILSNLIVIPAKIIPHFDSLSNIFFIVAFFLFFYKNVVMLMILVAILLIKNNSNYRFTLLLKRKGQELSKSDFECVYLYAWCTLLRYCLVGIALNQIFILIK